jgi:hypothetical protein
MPGVYSEQALQDVKMHPVQDCHARVMHYSYDHHHRTHHASYNSVRGIFPDLQPSKRKTECPEMGVKWISSLNGGLDEKFATKKYEVDWCKHEVQRNFGIYGSSRTKLFQESDHAFKSFRGQPRIGYHDYYPMAPNQM